MYVLLVYNDFDLSTLIFIGFFNKVNDILSYVNNIIKYGDMYRKNNKYKTYKNLFKIYKYNFNHKLHR